MIYGYIRVCSDKQTVENQRFEINNFCEKNEMKIDGWIEETISGTKYYVYTFDKTLDGSVLTGVIFNNGSAQTVDITNVTLDKDRFYRVLTTQTGGKYKYQEIADPR